MGRTHEPALRESHCVGTPRACPPRRSARGGLGPRRHAQPLSGMVAEGHRGAGRALRGGRRVRAGHEGPGRDGCRDQLPPRPARRPARDPDELPAHGHVRALAAHAGSGRHVRRTGDGDTGPPGREIDSSTSRPAASTSGAGRTSRSTAFATRLVGRLLRRAELDGAWDVPPVVAAVRLEHLRGLPVDDLHPAGEEPHTSTAATGISHAARTLARVHISSNAGVSAAHLSAASHAEPRSRQSRQRSSHTPPLQWRDQRGAGWSGSGTTFGFGIPFARR